MSIALIPKPNLESEIYLPKKQTEFIFNHLVGEVVHSVMAATVVLVLFSWVVDFAELTGWYIAMWLLALMRLLLWYYYRRSSPSLQSKRPWRDAYLALILVLGCTWAYGLIMTLPPVPVDYGFAMKFILFAQAILSLYQFWFYPRASYAFSMPIFVLFAILMFLEGTFISTAIGILCVMFFLVSASVGIKAKWYSNKKLELRAEVEQQKERAERANQAKSKFLAAASHDLRQPLYALALFLNMLQEEKLDANGREVVNNMSASLRSLEKLLEALLDISKLDAGAVTVEPTHFMLDRKLTPLCREFRELAFSGGIKFEYRICGDAVYTDGLLLELIVRNLLSNAVKYTQRGSVCVLAESRGDRIEFTVRDTGPGIAAEDHSRIFQEFVQLHNPERNSDKGLGLGLSIVKRLAEILGYNIELQSTPGSGTQFRVSIPRGDIDKVDRDECVRGTLPANVTGLRAWILEDDAEVRLALTSQLNKWGCITESFPDLESLKSRLDADALGPHAVIADYRFDRNATGVDAIHMIEDRFGKTFNAAIVTGETEPDQIITIQRYGFPLCYKPASPAQLKAFLSAASQRIQQRHSSSATRATTAP